MIDWNKVNSVLNKKQTKEKEFDSVEFLNEAYNKYKVLDKYEHLTSFVDNMFDSVVVDYPQFKLTVKQMMED